VPSFPAFISGQTTITANGKSWKRIIEAKKYIMKHFSGTETRRFMDVSFFEVDVGEILIEILQGDFNYSVRARFSAE
jgi:hypothetical protein